jgi:STE24 endopeptidase
LAGHEEDKLVKEESLKDDATKSVAHKEKNKLT